MTALRERFIDDLRLWNRSKNTQRAYVRAVRQLAEYYGKSPDQLDVEQIRRYLIHVVHERRLSRKTYNQVVSAIRFFYHKTLKREGFVAGIPCPRAGQTLPVVLSLEEIARLFGAIDNIKHRALVMTAYDAGRRVSEVISLRVEDIDSKRMVIRVRQGSRKCRPFVARVHSNSLQRASVKD